MTQFAALPPALTQAPTHVSKLDSGNQTEGSVEFAQVWLADAEINLPQEIPSYLAVDVPADADLADDGEVESSLEGVQREGRSKVEIEKQPKQAATPTDLEASLALTESTIPIQGSTTGGVPLRPNPVDAALPVGLNTTAVRSSQTNLIAPEMLAQSNTVDLPEPALVGSRSAINLQSDPSNTANLPAVRGNADQQPPNEVVPKNAYDTRARPGRDNTFHTVEMRSQGASQANALNEVRPLASSAHSAMSSSPQHPASQVVPSGQVSQNMQPRWPVRSDAPETQDVMRPIRNLTQPAAVTMPSQNAPSFSIAPGGQIPLLDVTLGADKSETDLPITALSQSTTTSVMTANAVENPSYARHVVQQIATAIVQTTGATTEIALNPEELGRVRISLTTGESGLTVAILAERPETIDLMRRNIEQLTRELRDMGYENPTFTFGDQSGAQDQDASDGSGPPSSDPAQTIEDLPQNSLRVALSGGLDLKL